MRLSKKNIALDLPISLGYFILQYAKLRMLQFYYDCIDVYVDRSDFEYIEMDTDSAYMALSYPSLIEAVKPALRNDFLKLINNSCNNENFCANEEHWFPRECCEKHIAYDKRSRGLFKLEAQGEAMFALSSKTYLLQQQNGIKMSCKGINKRSVTDPLAIFKDALFEKKSVSAQNMGFRVKNNTIYSYTQHRKGFGYFYCKREVMEDGLSTRPLQKVLCPWTDYKIEPFGKFHPLGLYYEQVFVRNGISFNCGIHAFMYEIVKFHDNTNLENVHKLNLEKLQKVVGGINLRTEWYNVRDKIMEEIMGDRLYQSSTIQQALQALMHDQLVYVDEGSKYWACGINEKLVYLTDPKCFIGNNRLGQLWNKIGDTFEW